MCRSPRSRNKKILAPQVSYKLIQKDTLCVAFSHSLQTYDAHMMPCVWQTDIYVARELDGGGLGLPRIRIPTGNGRMSVRLCDADNRSGLSHQPPDCSPVIGNVR